MSPSKAFYPYTRGSIYSGFVEGVHNDAERDLARSISGPNLVATMYLPGFGLRVFAELTTISYQLYTDLGPVPVCGQREIAGIVEGPIWVAGSIVFVYFDRHALLDILGYANGDSDEKFAKLKTMLRQRDWVELMNRIRIVDARKQFIEGNWDRPGFDIEEVEDLGKFVQKPNVTNVDDLRKSFDYFKEMYGVGTIDTTDINASVFNLQKGIAEMEHQYTIATQDLRKYKRRNADWKSTAGKMTALHLPPFNVLLFGANESGVAVKGGVYGIKIQSDSATMSIEDLITEGVCQYQAEAVDPIDGVDSVSASQQKLSLTYLQDQVETMETELWKRMGILRNAKVAAASSVQRKFYSSAYMISDQTLKFLGALSVTKDITNVYVRFPSQTQSNSPPIDSNLFADSKLSRYFVVLSGGELIPNEIERLVTVPNTLVRGWNRAGEQCSAIGYFIEADPAKESTAGEYGDIGDVFFPLSQVESVLHSSSPRIHLSGAYRVSVYFSARIPVRSDTEGVYRDLVEGKSNVVSSLQRRSSS